MNSNVKRLAAVAVVAATAVLAPAAGASAAVTPVGAISGPVFSLGANPGLAPGSIGFVAPEVAGPAVIGPTVFTVGAGNVFIATTITTTAGGAVVAAGPG